MDGWIVSRQLGFAIADQKEGDFELRVQWIKAVAQVETPGKKRKDVDDEDDDDRCVGLVSDPWLSGPLSTLTLALALYVMTHSNGTATETTGFQKPQDLVI